MMYAERVSVWGQGEADVTVTDGEHRCVAFCHPCSLTEGEEIAHPLSVLDMDGIVQSCEPVAGVESLPTSGPYAHRIIADVGVVEKGSARVKVGGLTFDVSPVPGDISPGDRVKFTAHRLDV